MRVRDQAQDGRAGNGSVVARRPWLQVRVVFATVLALLVLRTEAATVQVRTTAEFVAALAAAVEGTTIEMAPGIYSCAPVIGPGVTVRGAGHGQTRITPSADAAFGVLLKDGSGLAELSVSGVRGTGIRVESVADVTLSAVRVEDCTTGIRIQDSHTVRIENCVVSRTMTGISLQQVRGAAIVNNTLNECDSVGMLLVDLTEAAVFNNVVTHVGTAVSIVRAGQDLRLDHNLYLALFTGKIDGQRPRISLGPWRDVSGGLDANSVSLPVTYRDVAAGDYTPVSVLHWNPSVATTANWGVAALGGVAAPATDMNGAVRPIGRRGVGACEAAPAEPITVAGTFGVASSEGTKSAGIFRPDGTLVRYLFRDLPLPQGEYGFVLPSRGQLGEPLEAGDFELRLVESELRIRYRAYGEQRRGHQAGGFGPA